ncbi:hypothetical protein LX32DRAFT_367176 [Colletotrichum zoysiae]|uniref:Uncharacterized protein n=1 Tax=Colletotrichum zoysiae TaxID=1216348 RepID=A0AAD9M278_9PEZI|nr:hypothetical protein LX32DRAFT_367176 [Colletotrichum zoysiae]
MLFLFLGTAAMATALYMLVIGANFRVHLAKHTSHALLRCYQRFCAWWCYSMPLIRCISDRKCQRSSDQHPNSEIGS